MTILLLLFLSGLFLQGLKVLFTYAVIQVKGYVEAYDKKSLELFSWETNRIELGARTALNNRMNRMIHHDSKMLEEIPSDLLGNEAFMQPAFNQIV